MSRKHTIYKSQATGSKNRPLRTLKNYGNMELSCYQDDKGFVLETLAVAKIQRTKNI